MTHPREQLVGYVLGELTDREHADVEAHLDLCEACRAEVRDLERMWVASVESLPPVAPPDGTWAAIEARVSGQDDGRRGTAGAEPASGAHAPAGHRRPNRPSGRPEAPPRSRPGRGGAVAWMRVALALALVLVVGSGWWGVRQTRLRMHASSETAVIARWLARPDVRRVDLASSGKTVGAALVVPGGRALLVLPAPPSGGHSYQAWGLANGTAVSLGVTQQRAIEVPTRGYGAVAISLEPRGGSPAPTRVLGSAPVS